MPWTTMLTGVSCRLVMKLETIVVGPFEVNCYIYWDEQTTDGVIFDPGGDEGEIIDRVDRLGVTPRAILLTHGHGDHIAAVETVKDHYRIPLYIGRGDEELLRDPSKNVSAMYGQPIRAPEPDFVVTDEQSIRLGTVFLKALATPGHTAGGMCYLDEREGGLFCGDTLFWGSVGRTDLSGGSAVVLLESIRSKILSLPDEVICYPGHGPKTTVGAERANNPFLTGGNFA
ncbi:MAG: MBL fold metallo-hydrolase [candidate division Zixibacteria bacterium]|nr:MBL fold metallo-hydrolase [candidate division Zixibacteria bacterium]